MLYSHYNRNDMKKRNLLIFSIVLSLFLYISCSGDDEGSGNPPTISYVSINVPDTMVIDPTNTIILNPVGTTTPILGLGKWMYLNARFQDDADLSSFSVKLTLRSDKERSGVDTTYLISKGFTTIFGKRDVTVVRQSIVQIPDSITYSRNSTTVKVPIEQGTYNVQILCMNIYGQKDSVQYNIELFRPDTIQQVLSNRP